jgi:hypothetical protein
MPINRRSVTVFSASGTEMNKYGEQVKADSYYGYTDGLHTFQVRYNNFVGRFRIQATLSLEPTDSDWFDLVIDPLNGLYPGSNAWNEDGYIQYNANAPASKSEAYTFQGNFSFIRAFLDRRHVGDGETYDASYGSIDRVILSS